MLIKKQREEFQSYLEDTSNLKGCADILYIPQTPEEIPDIVRHCARKQVPLTCSGSRTGTTGGCVPLEGAILSLEKLNRIDLDPECGRVTVQAGTTLDGLETHLNQAGFTFKPKPTEALAAVAGAVSTCASGIRGFKYGSIRRYVSRVKLVLADGTVADIPRGTFRARGHTVSCAVSGKDIAFSLPSYRLPPVKSQAGYYVAKDMDLIDLFIGSEGTLGVITEVVLSIQRAAPALFDMIAFFEREKDGIACVKKIQQAACRDELSPASIEFFDANSLAFIKNDYPQIPSSQCAVYLEQECSGSDDDILLEKWETMLHSYNARGKRIWFGDTQPSREKIFRLRYSLPEHINEFLRQHNQTKVSGDIAVPPGAFDSMYALYKSEGNASGVAFVNFGHIGENHLHFNFLPRNDTEQEKAKIVMHSFMKHAVSLGGTISAEHGIGKLKKPYLGILYSKRQIQEMADLKRYFDPSCILGIDNIFKKSLLHE